MNLRIMGAAVIAGAALYGGYSTPALAADLGGDCCADLEERVAELEATTARKGNRRVSLEVYGQVNTAVMFWDDGDESDVFVVDNQTSNSRFGLQGSAKINPNLTAGFRIEIEGLTSESSNVSQDDDDGAGDDGKLEMRHAHWYLNHRSLGKLSVGRLSSATDGVAEIDLGGANIVAQAGIYFANDFVVVGTVDDTWDKFAVGEFDFSRVNAVRYDTPTFGGFTASTSFGEDDRWDITLRYAGEMAGFRLAAGIGYGIGDDNSDIGDPVVTNFDERSMLIGSASLLHVSTGLFVSGGGGQRTTELVGGGDFDEDYWNVRGGISKNWFGMGKTVLYGEYHNWQNGSNTDADMDIWGLGVVQNIDAAAMELYLAYKNYSVDIPNDDTEDLNLVITGARIKF